RIGNDVVGEGLERDYRPGINRRVRGIFVSGIPAGIHRFQSYAGRTSGLCTHQSIAATPEIDLLHAGGNGLADQIRRRRLKRNKQAKGPDHGIRAWRTVRRNRNELRLIRDTSRGRTKAVAPQIDLRKPARRATHEVCCSRIKGHNKSIDRCGRVSTRSIARDGWMIVAQRLFDRETPFVQDRKSTRLNSSHSQISYAVFCLKKKKNKTTQPTTTTPTTQTTR